MQDTFMSDSEDEGGEVECPIQQQQQYRYMNSEAGTLHRARPLEDSVTDGHLWPSNNDKNVATIDRQPRDIGFLVSFVVDARGGAMKAKRRGGVRIIVPPAACAAPTRVTCRAASKRAPVAAPPPLMEGEALASRLLELQPQGAKFLAPVIIEVPIFTAACPEREIVILRSDTGETWQDHYLHNNDNHMIQEALQRERLELGATNSCLGEHGERVTRIVTSDFPHYIAVVSRVRQEVHVVGPEGGAVSSKHIPQIQALFPPAALTKRIRVGLQAHRPAPPAAARVLPRHAAVSAVITVEPRRRKFHRSITLTAPLPAMEKPHDKQSSQSLRLLCSIMGGQARAVWEDVTGSTPITITEDCASFTTTVSARFWLMNCQNVSEATKLATELYREMLLVPFEVRIVVLGKRLDSVEGRLLVMYITDRYTYDTLLQQEHYVEVAHSTAVRFLDGKEVFLEFSGNLVPVTKSGSQPMFLFEAFKDNRVEFPVRVKHQEEPATGRVYFMNEPKVAKGEQSQTPACVLDVTLPEQIAPRAGKSQVDCLNLDQSGFDALKDELSFHWGDHNHSIVPPSIPTQVNGHDKIITNGDVIKHPAKEIDVHDTKPQVNGDTHVDSNKIKATFDSDEDKTPNNTLEKGKNKEDKPGFLGSLAGKVKNVFSHSEDKEDSKESSPKPKPRETKDKSPPKPAPRIINEELLDKVDDMFKDLKTKPHNKEEEIYATKLVVDEDIPSDMKNITVELPDYSNRQPVDTPLCSKTTDPFQFYVGCCEGKYAKGQKHRHDETSTVVDRIEQVKFSAQEKLQDISDRADNAAKDELEHLEKEKENIKQQANEEVEKIQADLRNKEKQIKTEANDAEKKMQDKFDELKELNEQIQDHLNTRAKETQSHVKSGVESAKDSAANVIDHLAHDINNAKDQACHKVQVLDFLAKEKEEELKIRSQDAKNEVKSAVNDAKHRADSVEKELKQKMNDGAKTIADNDHSAQDSLSNKAQQINDDIQEIAQHTKDNTADTINNISKSVENAKHKTENAAADLKSKATDAGQEVQKEAKKKSKSGKKFISGLVDNIFGEKKKVEDEVKSKVTEGKDSVNEALDKANAKKDEIKQDVEKKQEEIKQNVDKKQEEIKQNIDKKQEEIKQDANDLLQNIHDKKNEIESSVHETKDQITKSVNFKAEEAKKAAQDTANELEATIQNTTEQTKQAAQHAADELHASIQNKTDELANTITDKKAQVQEIAETELDRITKEAEATTEQIKKSAEEAVNAAADKKNEIQTNISDRVDELQQSGKHEAQQLQNAASDKVNDLQTSTKLALDDMQQSTLSSFDKVESSAKESLSGARDTLDDLHSSTRDTFADYKDDVQGLENSAQDTLHSFQSSAGNTFDSLEDSAREYITGAQNTAENHSKQLFGDAKDAFEGFQISADNKLQDINDSTKQTGQQIVSEYENVKDLTQERLEAAGERLTDVSEQAKDGARQSEKNVMDVVSSEADQFTSNLNDLGNSVFGSSGKGFMKDSSTKLLESEKSQSSPSPQKKGSGIPKLKQKRRK